MVADVVFARAAIANTNQMIESAVGVYCWGGGEGESEREKERARERDRERERERERSIAVTSPAPVRTASPVPVASSFRCLSPAASVRLAGAAVRAASPLVFATPVQRPRLPRALKVWQPLATQQHLMLQQLGVPGESHLLRPGAFEQVAGASLLTRTLSSWSAPGSPLY